MGIEKAVERVLAMGKEETSELRLRAFKAWQQHTSYWLPKLQSISCTPKNNMNFKRSRMRISYHKQKGIRTVSVRCPAGFFLWSGGCGTSSGINSLYPSSNQWVCSSVASEEV